MQTDARWKNKDYSPTGESTTIVESGCGPTCVDCNNIVLLKKLSYLLKNKIITTTGIT